MAARALRGFARVGAWFGLVRFSHSIFALPFALAGAWLAARGAPKLATLGWILVCAVAARTAAMAFNRWLDSGLDARNPRTRGREIPAGAISKAGALSLVVVASALFLFAAARLGAWCARLGVPVLAVLLGYSFTKRFTWLAHAVLGVALALAPLGAWLAVRGDFSGDLRVPLALALAVACWVAGFDLIYACQDVDFDRGARLHSVPARFGIARALLASRVLHAVTLLALCAVGLWADLSIVYSIALVAVAALLAYEHSLVGPGDLSRVDLAFFTVNGWIGVLFFLGLAIDLALER